MLKKYLFAAVFSIGLTGLNAQVDMEYWDHDSYLNIGGGMVMPGENLKSTSDMGFFAKNGYQINFDYNYIFGYGLGIGASVEYDQFKFDKEAFVEYADPEQMWVKGGYSSTKFGLNLVANIPIVVSKGNFAINFFGEFNAGLRGFNIPSIDLAYNEIVNKYVEVTYRSRSNTMGYLGYSGGLQFIFNDRIGINLSYNALLRSRHSVKYSVRMFDAADELYEEENYMNNFLEHTGFQLGIMFIFGKH